MTAFAVFDPQQDKDLSEHTSLSEAYLEIDRLQGAGRLGVRLARQHRTTLQRRDQERAKAPSFLVN